MKKIGFWWRSDFGHLKEYANLPKAQDHVDATWDADERSLVAAYLLDEQFENESYRGMSQCRFCGCFNGSRDYTDGTYLWPQGLAHYLIAHEVKPPQDFIDHVLAKRRPKKEPSDGARRAALRDPNYENMSARDQWDEDKRLGILDWDGK
jgi:hypothetical protein